MTRFAVVKTGGKQYVVQGDEVITVDRILHKTGKNVELEVLASFEGDGSKLELGTPFLKNKIKAEVIEDVKGDKIRISRFKSKVRYRKAKGFRPQLTKLKILGL